jgi:hypothetical protein
MRKDHSRGVSTFRTVGKTEGNLTDTRVTLEEDELCGEIVCAVSSSSDCDIGVVGRGIMTIDGRLLTARERSGVEEALLTGTYDDWSAG